jgi:hypothetical protein
MRGRRVTCGFGCLLAAALGACGESRPGADAGAEAEGGTAGTGVSPGGTGAGGSGQAGALVSGNAGAAGLDEAPTFAECTSECSFCGFADEDGDGWGNENRVCQDTYPGAVSGLGGDCNDTDPNLQRGLWVDEDHDGFGIQGATGCFGAEENPPGYAGNASDCIDDDPKFGPHVVDFAGDGVDRDCDGTDGGLDCVLEPGPLDVNAATRCDGFDLLTVEVGWCGFCNEIGYARIANVGTEPVEGTIYVTSAAGTQVQILEGLVAGEVSEPFRVPFLGEPFTLSTGEGIDCNPDNDTHATPASGTRTFCSIK